LIPDDVIGIFQ